MEEFTSEYEAFCVYRVQIFFFFSIFFFFFFRFMYTSRKVEGFLFFLFLRKKSVALYFDTKRNTFEINRFRYKTQC